MKINIEVELDFINEDCTLEDEFQQQIKKAIVSRIESVMVKTYKPLIDSSFDENVNKTIENILNNYMKKPIVVSNGYKTEDYESVLDMVEKKFTSLYDEKFRNKNGCNKDPIMEKITQHIQGSVSRLIDDMSSKVKREGDKIAKEAVKSSGLAIALGNLQKNK